MQDASVAIDLDLEPEGSVEWLAKQPIEVRFEKNRAVMYIGEGEDRRYHPVLLKRDRRWWDSLRHKKPGPSRLNLWRYTEGVYGERHHAFEHPGELDFLTEGGYKEIKRFVTEDIQPVFDEWLKRGYDNNGIRLRIAAEEMGNGS